MAGGTWVSQNKRRPGAYINVKAAPQPQATSDLGRVLMTTVDSLGWGEDGVIRLTSGSDTQALLGQSLDTPNLIAVREALKSANEVLLVNHGKGTKAKAEDTNGFPWEVTAKYAGELGNDITIVVEKNAKSPNVFTVKTLFGTKVVNLQKVNAARPHLVSNAYVDFKLIENQEEPKVEAETDGVVISAVEDSEWFKSLDNTTFKLVGGETDDGNPEGAEQALVEAMNNENYNVVTTAGFDAENGIHATIIDAAKDLRDETGYKVRVVIPADEFASKPVNQYFVSMVLNGVVLANGDEVSAKDATGWFAGASAAADAGTALTYVEYPDAVTAAPRLNNDDTIQALDRGEIVFSGRRSGTVVVEQDINSLVTLTDGVTADFMKNRVVRTIDTIVMNTSDTFENKYIGKVSNTDTGRNLFKGDRMAYLQELADAEVIDDFNGDDLGVEAGDSKDSVVVYLAITPVDSMEKLYMTINVR